MNISMKKMTTIALTAITLSAASYTYAAGYLLEYVYYSDSSRTTIVGEKVINQCYGSTYTTGTVTAYKKLVGREPCDWF